MTTRQMTSEPLPASDLFAERAVRSFPPRLVELRLFYDEAKAAYDAASKHEDDSGEEIPREIRMDFYHWERQLRIEEARVASADAERIHGGAGAGKQSEALPPLDGATC